MGSFITFAETLEKKIRSQIRSENPPETAFFRGENSIFPREWDFSPSGLAWLIAETPRSTTPAQRGKTAYGVKVRPLPPHKLTATQEKAVEFFALHRVSLSPRFSQTELKKAFRTLARRFHPDAGGSSQDFISLKAHVQGLMPLFKPHD